MDAIRQTITEGAKEKTLDGMTPDAKRFRTDLHKVQDSGVKHMVQKASETKDYEKMFSGDVDKAPARLGDMPASKDLDKYVEYNEAVQMAEAKKAAKDERGCSEECECKDCASDDKEEVKEVFAVPGTPAAAAYDKALKGNAGKQALPLQAGQKMGFSDRGIRKPVNPQAAAKPPVVNKTKAQAITQGYADKKKAEINKSVQLQKGAEARRGSDLTGPSSAPRPVVNKSRQDYGLGITQPKQKADARGTQDVKIVPTSGLPPAASATGPKASQVKAKPVKPGAPAPQKKTTPAAPPAVSAAQRREARRQLDRGGVVGREAKTLQQQSGLGVTTGKTVKQPARQAKKTPPGMGTKNQVLGQSFEIDIAGTSYLVSEAHASAIAAFVEKHGMISEGSVGEFISKEMKTPEKLTAKGKKQKIKQAIAIFYSKKRRGENP